MTKTKKNKQKPKQTEMEGNPCPQTQHSIGGLTSFIERLLVIS